MNKELREFTNKIMRLKFEAESSDDCRGGLLYALSFVQNHPFYSGQDIMSFSGFCSDTMELGSYVLDKLIGIIRFHDRG